MPYPDYYYFDLPTSSREFTKTPTGILDVQQLIRHKEDYWVLKQSGCRRARRTLVLNDCMAPIWSPSKRYELKSKLTTLIEDGFSIYYPTEDDLIQLTTDNLTLSLNAYARRRSLEHDEPLLKIVVSTLRIPSDQLLCLNYFEVNRLLADEYEAVAPKVISMQDKSLYFERYRKFDSDTMLADFLHELHNITPYNWVDQIKPFEKNQLLATSSENITQLSHVEIEEMADLDEHIEPWDTAQLKSLIFKGNDFSRLKEKLNQASKLEYLALYNLSPCDMSRHWDLSALKTFKSYSLIPECFTLDNLADLLTNASALTELNLGRLCVGKNELKFSFPKLQVLKEYIPYGNNTTLQTIIDASPNLHTLILSSSPREFCLRISTISRLYLSSVGLLQLGATLATLATAEKLVYLRMRLVPIALMRKRLEANPYRSESIPNKNDTISWFKSFSEKSPLLLLRSLDLLDSASVEADFLLYFLNIMPNLKKLIVGKLMILDMTNTLRSRLKEIPEIIGKIEEHSSLQEGRTNQSWWTLPPFHQTITFDAYTVDTQKTFECTRIFYVAKGEQPSVSSYRLSTYNTLRINKEPVSDLSQVFCLSNRVSELPEEGSRHMPQKKLNDLFTSLEALQSADNEHIYVYGKQSFKIYSDDWQALASLSPNEEMLHYHIEPKVPIIFKYDSFDNRYYVKSTDFNTQDVEIDFILKYPKQSPILSSETQTIIQKYQRFRAGELSLDGITLTGENLLKAIDAQELGACRHRAVACFNALKKLSKRRIVINDCHAFLEVNENGMWATCDLGGYHAEIYCHEPNNPKKLFNNSPTAMLNEEMLETLNITVNNKRVILYQQRMLQSEALVAKEELTLDGYLLSLTSDFASKRLIQLSNTIAIHDFIIQMHRHCNTIERPLFYVNSPDDLGCAGPFIRRDGNNGYKEEGPGGPLYDFFKENQDASNPPVILINYDQFNPKQIVQLNTIIDEHRHVDTNTVEILKEAILIGLINPAAPNAYDGADFYSRFDLGKIGPCGIPESLLKAGLDQSIPHYETEDGVIFIDLFHASDWKERLTGYSILNGDSLTYTEDLLKVAFSQGQDIVLKNAPWQDPDFCLFLALTKLRHKANSTVYQSDGYDWSNLTEDVSVETELDPEALVLNPTSLSHFFHYYDVSDAQQTIHYQDGLLAQRQNSTLSIYVTAPLNDNVWAMFLTECKKYHIILRIQYAPGVSGPVSAPSLHFEQTAPQPGTTVIISDDIHYTLKHDESIRQNRLLSKLAAESEATQQFASAVESHVSVIDISECAPSDLLEKIDGQYDAKQKKFVFKKLSSFLEDKLNRGESIILMGHFSSELTEALTPLLLERRNQYREHPGHLYILAATTTYFEFYPERQTREISKLEKHNALLRAYPDAKALLDESIENESFVRLEQRIRYLKRQSKVDDTLSPYQVSERNWAGLTSLPNYSPEPVEAEVFEERRINAVNAVLNDSRFVFLTGMTGVGKSTFVYQRWPEEGALFVGENKISDWLGADSTSGDKVLFIDEANISTSNWRLFYGLFSEPAELFYDSKLHRLGPNHKVVFAGNPLSYGGERTLASLFKDFGHTCLFEPMPATFMYTHVLQPLFAGSDLNAQVISAYFLDCYNWITQLESAYVLISPRELSTMALFTISYCKEHPEVYPEEVAQFYRNLVAETLVPRDQQNNFNLRFPKPSFIPEMVPFSSKTFLFTPSRLQAQQRLDAFLRTRLFKRNAAVNIAAGLNTFVLEGDSGIGKSQLITECLLQHGFVHGSHSEPSLHENTYYEMLPSLGVQEKKALLSKAFHEGAVVLINEINSVAMMEEFVNNLLMGKCEGKNPDKFGFMIVATRNDICLPGRRADSNAEARRALLSVLPPYSTQEMRQILFQNGLSSTDAYTLVYAFEQAKKINNKLTLRALLTCAKEELQGYTIKVNRYTAKDAHGMTPLMIAAKEKNAAEVQNILDDIQTLPIAEKEAILRDSKTALVLIAEHGELAVNILQSMHKVIPEDEIKQIIAENKWVKKTLYACYTGDDRNQLAKEISFQATNYSDLLFIFSHYSNKVEQQAFLKEVHTFANAQTPLEVAFEQLHRKAYLFTMHAASASAQQEKYAQAAQAALDIYHKLKSIPWQELSQEDKLKNFNNICNLNQYKILSTHRGCKQILYDILNAILFLGGLVKWAVTGKFRFFHTKTDTINIIENNIRNILLTRL